MTLRFTILLSMFLMAISCTQEQTPVSSPTPYHIEYPEAFPDMIIPTDNPTTNEGVQLGRRLYYDKLLHPNQSLSCSSCHHQSQAFSSSESNCLPHINLGWAQSYLWNGKIEGTLEDIMKFEVEDFFGTDLNLLNNDDEYPTLFFNAFGVSKITSKEVAYALAQWFRVMNSTNSKYDRFLLGLEAFTPEEMDGYDIFFTERGDCFHCHGGPLMSDNLFHNNGLDMTPEEGRYEISQNTADIGKFKTPTLRNIEVTGPYMHDGRFSSLEEVVDFYASGLQWSPTIDPLMKKIEFGGIALSPSEKANLVSFLKTLTDHSFLNNPDLSDPF